MQQILLHVFGELTGVNGNIDNRRHELLFTETAAQHKSGLRLCPQFVFVENMRCVDLGETRVHIARMNFDISNLLAQWDYQPGQVVVRKFKGNDGAEKIQLRVDMGLLQMNATGRPDGKRALGHPSLFDYYQAQLYKHLAGHDGSDEGFSLNAEDCAKLQLEALQYHHRYICLLQLEDYDGVIRDTERNLAVFAFVSAHAETEELAWSLQQFQTQLLMIHTRAHATQSLRVDDYPAAVKQIEAGVERIREF